MSTLRTLLIGVTAGAVLGILYAPEKGAITRSKLARKGEDLKDRFNELRDSISDKLDNLRDDMSEMAYQEMERLEVDEIRNDISAERPSWQS